MKKFFLIVFALFCFSFLVKAQYYNNYNYGYNYGYNNYGYNYGYNNNYVVRQDLGPYGYGQLYSSIQNNGYRVSPYSFQKREMVNMNVFGRYLQFLAISNLNITYSGSLIWIDYYLNGIRVGNASFEGRFMTVTFYRSSLEGALRSRGYY